MCAASSGHTEIVKLLLERGADVNITNHYSCTVLVSASNEGNAEIVKLLLAHGADVNIRNRSNRTALMCAASSGHTEIVKLLLEHGADVNMKDSWNSTAFDLADREEIKTLLNQYKQHQGEAQPSSSGTEDKNNVPQE